MLYVLSRLFTKQLGLIKALLLITHLYPTGVTRNNDSLEGFLEENMYNSFLSCFII